MKLSVVAATGFFAVALGTKPKQCSKKCYNAIISDTPVIIGEAFCSSFLSLEPLAAVTATVTVVRDEVVTTSTTKSETTITTVTTTDATITTTTGTVTSLVYKRAQTLSDPSSSILSVCKTKSALISSICSHLLPAATAPTSTVTLEHTSTSTTVVQLTTTAVETTTATTTVTEYAVATALTYPFGNGAFTGSILPWTTTARDGDVVHLPDAEVCQTSASGTICGESDVLRLTPRAMGTVSIAQTFEALPSTTYKVSLNINVPGTTPNVFVLTMKYNDASLTSYTIPGATIGQHPWETLSLWEFTTDADGKGTLEILLQCVSANPNGCGFIFLDNVAVVKKV